MWMHKQGPQEFDLILGQKSLSVIGTNTNCHPVVVIIYHHASTDLLPYILSHINFTETIMMGPWIDNTILYVTYPIGLMAFPW